MPLIKRFNASHEYSRLLSTSRNRDKEREHFHSLLPPYAPRSTTNATAGSDTEQETPLHNVLPLLEETQAAFQRLRRDSDFSQTNISDSALRSSRLRVSWRPSPPLSERI
ncbi:hypothetical protein BDR05DRAFT_1056195 [Suillus weaverae]|nr:hypothetical protein BDR05DRAFT_1056195 [Suillus weaverae]